MVAEITDGVKVIVETEYQPSYSSPSQYHYVFTYKITIENQSAGIGTSMMPDLRHAKWKAKA
jgi:uncharacterized protein affecting Mg2+/Co2+ transport